jgi:hypothetical protein
MARSLPEHLSGFTKRLRRETNATYEKKSKTDAFIRNKVNEKLQLQNLTKSDKEKPKRCLSSGVATRHYRAPELILIEPQYD